MFSRETEAFDREMGGMLYLLQLQLHVCRLSWYGALPPAVTQGSHGDGNETTQTYTRNVDLMNFACGSAGAEVKTRGRGRRKQAANPFRAVFSLTVPVGRRNEALIS